MRTIILLITFLLCARTTYGRDLSCIPRAEMGETTTGRHLYERDTDLKIKNLSRVNFDKLTIISAEGKSIKIVKVEKNIYKTTGSGTPYYFVTNDTGSIVTELSVKGSATYVKVLLCK